MSRNSSKEAKRILYFASGLLHIGFQKGFDHTLISLTIVQVGNEGNRKKDRTQQKKESNEEVEFPVLQKSEFDGWLVFFRGFSLVCIPSQSLRLVN